MDRFIQFRVPDFGNSDYGLSVGPHAVIVYSRLEHNQATPHSQSCQALFCRSPEILRLPPRRRGAHLASFPKSNPSRPRSPILGMASDTEGIAALFSMYNDDEDEEDDADEPNPPSPAPPTASAATADASSSSPPSQAGGEDPNRSLVPPSPPLTEESAGRKTLASPHPSPARAQLPPLPSRRSSSPFPASSPSPLRGSSFAPPPDLPRPPRRGALAIVDYAHDEMAMSPEQEVEPVKYVFCTTARNLLVF